MKIMKKCVKLLLALVLAACVAPSFVQKAEAATLTKQIGNFKVTLNADLINQLDSVFDEDMVIHSFDVSISDGTYSDGSFFGEGWWLKPSVSARINVHCPRMPELQHQLDKEVSAYLTMDNIECTKAGTWTANKTTEQLFSVRTSYMEHRLRMRLTMTVTYSPAASHDFSGEPYATRPSDCATHGKKIFLCQNKPCTVVHAEQLPLDASAHSWNAWENNGNGTHSRTCKNDATHKETGTCSGGSATCVSGAVCDVCRKEYTSRLEHEYHVSTATDLFGDNVLVQGCNLGCGHLETATLTAADATYTGSELETGSISYSGTWADPMPVLTYENNKNAGTATATMTAGGKSVSVHFNIARANVGVEQYPAAQNGAYNGDDQLLLHTGHANYGTFWYRLEGGAWSEEVPSAKEAGTYNVYYKVEPVDANFTPLDETLIVAEIKKADMELVQVSAPSVTYNGQVHTPAVEAEATTKGSMPVTFAYSMTQDGIYGDVPSFTNAGSYTIWYKATAANHNDYTGSFVFTIAKQEVTPPTIASAEYDGQLHKPEVADTVHYTVTQNDGGINGGEYDVVLTLKDPTNYTWPGVDTAELTLKFKITAADNMWIREPSIQGWTYGEPASAPDMGQARYGSVNVFYEGITNAGVEVMRLDPPTEAGAYKAVFMVLANHSYHSLSCEVPFTIERASGLTAAAFDFQAPDPVYNAGEKHPVLSPKPAFTGVGNVIVHTDPTPAVQVGTYQVSIDVEQGANYEAASGLTDPSWTFAITKAPAPDVELPDAVLDYGKSLSEAWLSDPTWNWHNPGTVPADHSVHDAWQSVDDDNYDYTGVEGYEPDHSRVTRGLQVVLNPVAPLITLDTAPEQVFYDSVIMVSETVRNPYNDSFTDLPEVYFSYRINGGTWNAFNGTLDLSAHSVTTGDEIEIKAFTAKQGLYAAAETSTTLTVVDKPRQTITSQDITRTYGDGSFTISASSNAGALSYSVISGSDVVSVEAGNGEAQILNAGTAQVRITAAETADYAATTKDITVTVNPKNMTAAPKAVVLTQNDPAPALEMIYTGLVGTDSVGSKSIDLRIFDKDGKEVSVEEAVRTYGDYTIRWVNLEDVSFDEMTNYRVTKVESADFHVKVLYIAESKKSSSSYAPVPVSVTVPVSGEEKTIYVDATVKDGVATLEKISDAQLNKVIGSQVKTGTLTMDFSGLKQKVHTVVLHTGTVSQIAKAAQDENNDTEAMQIKFAKDLSVEFCAESLEDGLKQAKGQKITISVKPGREVKDLTAQQKQAVGSRVAYLVSVMSGKDVFTELEGEITIQAPYTLKPGEQAEGLAVFSVGEDGEKELCETSYDAETKQLTWKTDTLSLFVVEYQK